MTTAISQPVDGWTRLGTTRLVQRLQRAAGCARIWKAFVAAPVRRLRPDLHVVGDAVDLQVCGDR